MDSIKEITKNILVFLISVLVILLIFEGIMRIFPNPLTEYNSTFSYRFDKDVGFTALPSQEASWNSKYYRIRPIRTNSIGFRDNEWHKGKGQIIAVLGDSFMEAKAVPEGAYFSSTLNKLISCEVLNTGISGYGTVAERVVYKKYLKAFKPAVVLLFFYPDNDPSDNSWELSRLVGFFKEHPCGYIDNKGEIKFITKIKETRLSIFEQNSKILREYCLTFVAFYKLYKCTYAACLNMRINNLSCGKNLLTVPSPYKYINENEERKWDDAWKITEKALFLLSNEIKTDGGKLIVISVPNSFRCIPFEGKDMGPEKIDGNPYLQLNRLRNIVKKNGLNYLELESFFNDYVNTNCLKYPYIMYVKDGHWNPVGHFLASNIIARYLINNNYIQFNKKEKKALLAKINHNLRLSPRQILGETGYKQIYQGGIFKGSTNIKAILGGEKQ